MCVRGASYLLFSSLTSIDEVQTSKPSNEVATVYIISVKEDPRLAKNREFALY